MIVQTRAKTTLWPKVEATLKLMDTAATELECFKALQKQEQLAASHRINSLWEEVQKQKELERTLQRRYGDLVAELDRIQHLMDEYRIQAQKQEEIAAENHALELAKAAEDENAGQQMDGEQEHAYASPKPDMDIDAQNEHAPLCMVGSLSTNMPDAVGGEKTTPAQGYSSEGTADIQLSHSDRDNPNGVPEIVVGEENKTVIESVDGAAGATDITPEVTKVNPDFEDQQNVVEAINLDCVVNKEEDCVPETDDNSGCANGDAMQVSGAEGGMLNSAGDNTDQMPNVLKAEAFLDGDSTEKQTETADMSTNSKQVITKFDD